jgi:hypothetical protein
MVKRPSLQVVEEREQPDAPAPSPRQALAFAIAERDRVGQIAEQARQAVQRARQLTYDAEAHLEAAQLSVEEAREKHSRLVTEAVAAGSKLPSSSIRQARINEAEAEDALRAARAALERLQVALVVAEGDLRTSAATVLERAKLVMASETTAMPSDMKQAIEAFIAQVAVFGYLVKSQIISDFQPPSDPSQLVHHDPMFRHPAGPSVQMLRALGLSGWAPSWLAQVEDHSAIAAWRAALEELQRDPDTPLPTR